MGGLCPDVRRKAKQKRQCRQKELECSTDMTTFHDVKRTVATLCLSLLIVSSSAAARADDNPLAIIDGGVQRSDDAPYVPKDFQFLPGDFVYFSFHISGFATKTNETTEVKSLSLEYEVTPRDVNQIPLAEPVEGTIAEDLSKEDKNWTPKRRASFLLPSYVAAGQFNIHVVVRDLIAKTEAERDYPFLIGGVQIANAATIQAESFVFLRNQDDEKALDLPAYAPGDTVFAHFQMIGFKNEAGNTYKLSYGVKVLRPDGKVFLEVPNAAQISSSSFYPAQFVPGELQVNTPKDAAHGAYVLTLTVRDLVANQSFDLQRSFTIE